MIRVLTILFITMTFSLAFEPPSFRLSGSGEEQPEKRHSIGSSLFLLGNIIPEDDIYAFQLDYYYKLTEKDVLIIEGIT